MAVDDEPDDIFFLRRVINQVGFPHRFQPFANGDAAMTSLGSMLAGQSAFDLPLVCFLDIKMAAMTGFDLLRWIRAQKGLDCMPAIMFSSSDDPRDVDMARELGAQGYLKKYPSAPAMRTILEEAREFSLLPSPKKSFLQWSYRFVDTAAPVAVK